MSLNFSRPDWEQRLRAGESLLPDLVLPNPGEGDRAVNIFNRLRLYDVAGTPTMAEAGGEWFRQIIWALFASLDPATQARLIQEVFLLVPKKQNKTTGGALLMVTALLMNQRPRAPFLMTAPFQKQANEAFSAAAGAIALDPVLDKTFHVRDHLKMIVHRETKATLEILTFDPGMVTGKKVAGGLIDELHVLGKMPRANKAMVQLRGGMLPFPEAFLFTITTQSDDAPTGVFAEDLKRARDIRDGEREGGRTLPVLYEFPSAMQQDPTMPWRNPANWHMVTPNLGRPMSLQTMEASFVDEEAKGDAALRIWASQHLNIQIGLALHSDRWAGATHWPKRAAKGLTFEQILSRSDVVVVGIDGGGLDDMLGLAIMGRDENTGQWLLWTRAWIHQCAMERRKENAPRYLDFVADGDLVVVPDDSDDDIQQVAELVAEVVDAGLLGKVGVDPVGIGAIVDALQADDCGVLEDQIVGVSQGYKLMGAIKTVERKLASGGMVHSGSRLMDWCVGNCKVVPKDNAVVITKQASGLAKIDPAMAAFNAATLMAMAPPQNVIGEGYELLVA